MSRRIVALAMVVIFSSALAGCMTESGYYSPGASAGAGALGGAATGSPGTGAWVGAAAGGVLGGVGGYLYAQHRNSEIRSAQVAAETYNYDASRGASVVAIDATEASPGSVYPGQPVNLGLTYHILTPSNAPTTVTLVREVRYGGNLLGEPYQTTVSNANGTFSDSVTYTLPREAPRGAYTVTTRVISSYGGDQRDSYFTVR